MKMTINTLNLESEIGDKRVEHLWLALSPGVGVKTAALASKIETLSSSQSA